MHVNFLKFDYRGFGQGRVGARLVQLYLEIIFAHFEGL